MTTPLTPTIIRTAFVKDSHQPVLDIIPPTPATPLIWRGTTVIWQIGLFVGTALVDDKSTIAQLYLEIHDPRSSHPLLQKEVLAADIDVTVTAETWVNKTKQHASIELTAEETQFDVAAGSNDTKALWFVCHVVTTNGKKITCGGGQINVEEDGAQNGLAVVPQSDPSFRIKGGDVQLWNPTQSKFQGFHPEGAPGQEHIVWHQGEE